MTGYVSDRVAVSDGKTQRSVLRVAAYGNGSKVAIACVGADAQAFGNVARGDTVDVEGTIASASDASVAFATRFAPIVITDCGIHESER